LYLSHDIPGGNVVMKAWSDESTFTAFRDSTYAVMEDDSPMPSDFNFPTPDAWPDPKGMVDDLHDADVRRHLWQIPLISTALERRKNWIQIRRG